MAPASRMDTQLAPVVVLALALVLAPLPAAGLVRSSSKGGGQQSGDACPPGSMCPSFDSASLRLKRATEQDQKSLSLASRTGTNRRMPPAQASLPRMEAPAVFVNIFTSPELEDRRHGARNGWRFARGASAWFVLCSRIDITTAREKHGKQQEMQEETQSELSPEDLSYMQDVQAKFEAAQEEARVYGDILFLDCTEGYSNGRLTMKLEAAMRYYLKATAGVPFFMKTDDDTFVKFNALLPVLQRERSENLLVGLIQRIAGPVVRNPAKKWYEPRSAWPEEKYLSPTISGGPGYVVSRPLVEKIIQNDLPRKYLLWNEDKALSVWIIKLEDAHSIKRVNVHGTDGYTFDLLARCLTFMNSQWSEYDLILHHNLPPETVACLGRQWFPNAKLGQCFCII
mmetsp:Transcript_6809/g.18860  ORF Transcript_6809/g.18860 Transcript_6809/m.18860 type:complete len:398 (-) Transcript_6809:114-1307(-)